MRKKLSRYKLKKWLKGAKGLALTSIVLLGGVDTIHTNITSTQKLYESMEQRLEMFPKQGSYLISYEPGDGSDADDLESTRFIFLIATEERYRGGAKSGDLRALEEKLSAQEYIFIARHVTPEYEIASIMVTQPHDPSELNEFVSDLKEYSRWLATDDGSGYMHALNVHIGKNSLQAGT